jgi:hypothetical protein
LRPGHDAVAFAAHDNGVSTSFRLPPKASGVGFDRGIRRRHPPSPRLRRTRGYGGQGGRCLSGEEWSARTRILRNEPKRVTGSCVLICLSGNSLARRACVQGLGSFSAQPRPQSRGEPQTSEAGGTPAPLARRGSMSAFRALQLQPLHDLSSAGTDGCRIK